MNTFHTKTTIGDNDKMFAVEVDGKFHGVRYVGLGFFESSWSGLTRAQAWAVVKAAAPGSSARVFTPGRTVWVRNGAGHAGQYVGQFA